MTKGEIDGGEGNGRGVRQDRKDGKRGWVKGREGDECGKQTVTDNNSIQLPAVQVVILLPISVTFSRLWL
jgi:hypothetical protein